MAQKTYVGNGKKRSPSWLKLNLDIDKLIAGSYESKGRRYVNIDVNLKDAPDQYGKDVSATLDEWKPTAAGNAAPPAAAAPAAAASASDIADDLPF